MEIQQVCSGGCHLDTSRDLMGLYWKRTDRKGLDKLRRELDVKTVFDWYNREGSHLRDAERERGHNVKKGSGKKIPFAWVFWSISNRRFITGQWVKLSRTNMTCMGVIPQTCLQRHYMDLNCVLLKIHPCCDTNRKSSAVINLVVSSHCLLICWPVWSHCYLVLALFVSSIHLPAHNFYYKVFNITIKKKTRMLTQWGLEVASSDLKYCQSYPPLFVFLIVIDHPFPHSNTTLLQLCYKLNGEIGLARNTGGRGKSWISFCWISSPIWLGAQPHLGCASTVQGKGQYRIRAEKEAVGHGHP